MEQLATTYEVNGQKEKCGVFFSEMCGNKQAKPSGAVSLNVQVWCFLKLGLQNPKPKECAASAKGKIY